MSSFLLFSCTNFVAKSRNEPVEKRGDAQSTVLRFQVAKRMILKARRRVLWAPRRVRSNVKRALLSRIISSRHSRRVSSGKSTSACRTGWSWRRNCSWRTRKWKRGTKTEGKRNVGEAALLIRKWGKIRRHMRTIINSTIVDAGCERSRDYQRSDVWKFVRDWSITDGAGRMFATG